MSRVRRSINEKNIFSIDCFPSRHGETPGDEQIERFIEVCKDYSNTNPDHIIGRVKIYVFRDSSKNKLISFFRRSLYARI